MANPFFSGRIPQDLLGRVEQHVKETGQSKTEILIDALAAYLNHPVIKPVPTSMGFASEARFEALERRVELLEALAGRDSDKNIVIRPDNNTSLGITIEPSAALEQKLEKTEDYDNNSNKNDNGFVITTSDNVIVFSADNLDGSKLSNYDNKSDNNDENVIQKQEEPLRLVPEQALDKFENLTSTELTKITDLKPPQIDGHKRKVTMKYRKLDQILEDKKLLENPEKIEALKPIMVNGYPYDLFYLGQNEKGNNMWTVLPFDNERYQQLSIKINSKSFDLPFS